MVGISDNLRLAADAITSHKLRSLLTALGLTMGVATLITVMTLVQGANLYVEQKIANLGTNVFRLGQNSLRGRGLLRRRESAQEQKLRRRVTSAPSPNCAVRAKPSARAQRHLPCSITTKQTDVTSIIGHTPSMADIDTRTLDPGRYFTALEDAHAEYVCIIGAARRTLLSQREPHRPHPSHREPEFTVIGTFQKLGSVLGQDQDNYVIVPLTTYLKVRGSRSSLTLEIKASGGDETFAAAQDEARVIMRPAAMTRPARKIASSSAPRKAISRSGRASAVPSLPSSSWSVRSRLSSAESSS